MILHYLKIALRNLLKYRTQTAISVLGLAVGFTCFAFAIRWIHYETTFDAFHRDADRIYLVTTNSHDLSGKHSSATPNALSSYLKENYLEVEEGISFLHNPLSISHEGDVIKMERIGADTAFMRMMDIRVLEGTSQFLTQKNEIAITREGAFRLFGTDKVIGKTITTHQDKQEYRIGAIVSGWGKHSTLPYELVSGVSVPPLWNNDFFMTLIKVKVGTDVKALEEKMSQHFPKEMKDFYSRASRFWLTPLTDIRHADYLYAADSIVALRYVVYCSIVGILIIVCSLVNFLTLFVDRLRIRRREMALRKVHGASEGSLLRMLLTDVSIILLMALVIGMMFIELLQSPFAQLTGIPFEELSIYRKCLIYVIGIVLASWLIAGMVIVFFRHHSLHEAITRGHRSEQRFRKFNIGLQLMVCIAFVLATFIMQKQIHHLRNKEVGFEYQHRASMKIWGADMNVWVEKLKALPMVTEVLPPIYQPLVKQAITVTTSIYSWDGLGKDLDTPIILLRMNAGQEMFEFYHTKLLAGQWMNEESSRDDVIIMANMAKKMGWKPEEAIGKQFYLAQGNHFPKTIVGVLEDCYFNGLTGEAPFTIFENTYHRKWAWTDCSILFKYRPDTWEKCSLQIKKMVEAEHPDKELMLFSEEETFNDYLKAESLLSQLLNFASMVCMLIAIFGIYSLITLTCEQRRKEIAIRKVNGATVSVILRMFLREYMALLGAAAFVAFPVTYAVMKRWIETYNRQTDIGVWPFISVLCIMAFVIIGSISWRVWKAANENPADVVKSE